MGADVTHLANALAEIRKHINKEQLGELADSRVDASARIVDEEISRLKQEIRQRDFDLYNLKLQLYNHSKEFQEMKKMLLQHTSIEQMRQIDNFGMISNNPLPEIRNTPIRNASDTSANNPVEDEKKKTKGFLSWFFEEE